MALGDMVVMALETFSLGLPRLRGFVVNVPGGGQSDVVWENGKRTDALPDGVLQLVFAPAASRQALEDVVGRYVQITTWANPLSAPAGATPKSPAASGVARRAYGTNTIGSGSPTGEVVDVEILDGKAALSVASADAVVAQTRRKVFEPG